MISSGMAGAEGVLLDLEAAGAAGDHAPDTCQGNGILDQSNGQAAGDPFSEIDGLASHKKTASELQVPVSAAPGAWYHSGQIQGLEDTC